MTQINLRFHFLPLLPFLSFSGDLSLLSLPFLLLLLDDLFSLLLLQSELRLLTFLHVSLLLEHLLFLYSVFSLSLCMALAYDLSGLRIPLYSSHVSYESYHILEFLIHFLMLVFHIHYSILTPLSFCFRIVCIDLRLTLALHSITLHNRYYMAMDIYTYIPLHYPSYLSLLFAGFLYLASLLLLLLKNHILYYIPLSLFSSHLALLLLAFLLTYLIFLMTFLFYFFTSVLFTFYTLLFLLLFFYFSFFFYFHSFHFLLINYKFFHLSFIHFTLLRSIHFIFLYYFVIILYYFFTFLWDYSI